MQTPVRYYITQNDDRPVVRTVPVALAARQQHRQRDLVAGERAMQHPETRARLLRIAQLRRVLRDGR